MCEARKSKFKKVMNNDFYFQGTLYVEYLGIFHKNLLTK